MDFLLGFDELRNIIIHLGKQYRVLQPSSDTWHAWLMFY